MSKSGPLGLLLAIIEIPWLFVLNIWNHFWTLGLWIREIRQYYAGPHLRKADLLMMVEYGLRSPFTISRKATRKGHLPEDLTVYGETPWTTLERALQAVNMRAEDVFVELGAGTGRNLLFVHYFYGARAIGYEIVERFVEKFSWLQFHLKLSDKSEMRAANWFEADLEKEGGNVFFLVGSCYSDDHLKLANHKLSSLKSGARIITVSYPLDEDDFEAIGHFEAPFSWGRGTIFLQRRR